LAASSAYRGQLGRPGIRARRFDRQATARLAGAEATAHELPIAPRPPPVTCRQSREQQEIQQRIAATVFCRAVLSVDEHRNDTWFAGLPSSGDPVRPAASRDAMSCAPCTPTSSYLSWCHGWWPTGAAGAGHSRGPYLDERRAQADRDVALVDCAVAELEQT
jgi:hypothetical protein